MGNRVNLNQGEQSDRVYPYVILALKANASACRDRGDKSGMVAIELYAETYKSMMEVKTELEAALSDKYFSVGGYRCDFEALEEEVDKVTTETDGLTFKEFTINYYINENY